MGPGGDHGLPGRPPLISARAAATVEGYRTGFGPSPGSVFIRPTATTATNF